MKFELPNGAFPVGGWAGPPMAVDGSPSFLEDKYFALMRDAGINIMYANTEGNGVPEVLKGLELCERNGVYYLVNDQRYWKPDFSEEEGWKQYEKYAKYRSFVGIAVHDEPFFRHMEALKEGRERHKRVFERTHFHTNLFPVRCDSAGVTMRDTHERSSVEEYVAYIETYIRCVKPELLSYDFYPFHKEFGYCDPDWFFQMEFIRRYAVKLGVPYWCFVQVTSWHKGIIRNTNETEIRWQAFTALAFGVKGLNYFTFCTPVDRGGENFDDAMIDRHGNVTPSYGYVQRTNARVQPIGKRLLSAEHKAVVTPERCIAPMETEIGCKSYGNFAGKTDGEPVMIGVFEDGGKSLYFPVNTSLSGIVPFKMNFLQAVRLRDAETGKIYEGKEIKLELAPADGVLLEQID